MDILYFIYLILSRLIQAYSTLIIIYILMSWFPGAYQSKIGQIIVRLCEPYLGFFRRFIPPIGMISFSGIVAIVVLNLAQRGLFSLYQIIARVILGF
ncbi:YggT family protein [Carnobacterium iners]|uniref:YggT family protein n=1 Tax=Carnobacterium iners TaxID=1073423 RepID=A0A1X7NQB6_9LACT|nr:YggT family protein [Carnobacterium iners]MCA9765843.1 YggT family protein [Carnobacterium sp.]SEK30807.1 YggT family protein [Carnobacterium iners]SMH39459.1 YggT family protein [Carnobacterium iners]